MRALTKTAEATQHLVERRSEISLSAIVAQAKVFESAGRVDQPRQSKVAS